MRKLLIKPVPPVVMRWFYDGKHLYIPSSKGAAQRATYTEHKRRNSIKFQAVSCPDGLILHIYGPLESRRHDITMFRLSGIEANLSDSLLIDGRKCFIYGDPAYILRAYLQIGFGGGNLTPPQSSISKGMAQVLISVEWGSKDIKKYFTDAYFARKMVIGKVPVAKW